LLLYDCSDYVRNVTDVNSEVVSAPLNTRAVNAIWQLTLALIFKMVITIFTFGIKVSGAHFGAFCWF
jgi:chloride channel 3/4/5